jgi:hypothetical protein
MQFHDVLVETLFEFNDSDPFAPDGIYAKVEVPYGNPSAGKTFFHLILTTEQMNYRHKLDLDTPGNSDSFAKTLRKADKAWTKEVRKSDGELVISPLHVFGSSMVDYETGEVLTPDDKPNEIVPEKVWIYTEPSDEVTDVS